MKRIFIYKDKETQKILRVDFHKAHANDCLSVINAEIQRFNKDSAKREVELLEVEETIYNIISFCLNDNEYKTAKNIEDVLSKMKDINDKIVDIQTDIEVLNDYCEKIKEEQKKEVKNEI